MHTFRTIHRLLCTGFNGYGTFITFAIYETQLPISEPQDNIKQFGLGSSTLEYTHQ